MTQIFLDECNSAGGMGFENIEEHTRLGRASMAYPNANSQTPQYFDDKDFPRMSMGSPFDQSTGSQGARSTVEPVEYLEACQTSLSLLGLALQSDCS